MTSLTVTAGGNTLAGYAFTRDQNGNITQDNATTPLSPSFANATWAYMLMGTHMRPKHGRVNAATLGAG